MRGAVTTAFVLILMQVAFTTRLPGLLAAAAAPAAWARAWMDPTVPLIPQGPAAAGPGGTQAGLGPHTRTVNLSVPPSGSSGSGGGGGPKPQP